MSDVAAYTIPEFCARNKICRVSFYNALKAGKGPRTFRVGNRRLVSAEAERDWIRDREAEAAAEAAA
jgi:hypothetical protein